MASTIKSGSNNDLYIQTDGVDRIVVDSNGNTSVVGELEVNSSSSATWSNITNTAGSGNRYSGIKMQDGATINSHIYTNHQDGNFAIRNDFAGGVTRFYTTPSGGALQESMAVNGNGYVTKPYQPSFYAFGAGYTRADNSVYAPTWTMNHNTGNHFSTSTDAFTAPIDGTYMLTYKVGHSGNATNTGDAWALGIYINGAFPNASGTSTWYGDGGVENGVEGTHSGTVIVQLSQNDSVVLWTTGTALAITFNTGYFCGHLLG